MKFHVALVTPFDSRGRVDHAALRAHVLWLCAKGVDGFFVCDTNGEFFYLSEREREAINRTVCDTAKPIGKSVWCHAYDASPQSTVFLAQSAMEAGADGLLLAPPLYYPLDEPTVETWYRGIHERVDGAPILAYHHPRYIPTGISPGLYSKLRGEGVLHGMLDSSGDNWRVRRIADEDRGALFAGDDRTLHETPEIPHLAGFVSGVGNVWPELCLRVFRDGEMDLAEALRDRVVKVKRAGGIRAIKGLLRMGFRMPILASSVEGLPTRERV